MEYNIFNDVFVSYSRDDEEFIKELVRDLESRGLTVWYDRDDIPKGANWREAILTGVQGALSFLFVISPSSIASVECTKEVQIAVDEKKRFIPVLYRDVSDEDYRKMHPAIGAHNWIFGNFKPDEEKTEPENNSARHQFWITMMGTVIQTIQTDLDHVRSHTNWNLRAVNWQQRNKDTSFLLTGSELVDAEKWIQSSSDKEPEPTPLHHTYINASRNEVASRLRNIYSAVAVALVIVSILAVISFGLYQLAESQRQTIAQNFENIRSLALSSAQQLRTPNQIQRLAFGIQATNIDNPPLQSWQLLAELAYSPGPIDYRHLHEAQINDIVLSPDGTQALSVDEDAHVILWDTRTHDVIEQWQPDGVHSLNSALFAPDGIHLWVAGCNTVDTVDDAICTNADILVINRNNGSIIPLSGHVSEVTSLNLSPDQRQIISTSIGGNAILWNAITFNQVNRVRLHVKDTADNAIDNGNIWSARLSAEGNLITASEDRTLMRWNSDLEQLAVSDVHDNAVWTLAITRDDAYVVSATPGGNLYVWDANTLEAIDFYPDAHRDVIQDIVTLSDGRILSASWDGLINIWRITNGRLEQVGQLSGQGTRVMSLTVDDEHQRAFSGGEDGSLVTWDLSRGDIIEEFVGHSTWPRSLSLNQDGTQFLSASSGAEIYLWDWQTTTIEKQFDGHTGNIRRIIYHPDDTQFLSTSEDGSLKLWDINQDEPVQTYGDGATAYFDGVFNSDGSQIIAGGSQGALQLWDTTSGELIQTFEGHEDIVRKVLFLPDDQRILSAGYDGTLRLWNISTGETIRTYEGHDGRIISIALRPDAQQFISAGADDFSLILWDIESGNIIHRLLGHRDFVIDVAFSPDGKRVASAGWDGEIILWDVAQGSLIHPYQGHRGNISSIVFTPDGHNAISLGTYPDSGIPDIFGQFIVWRVDDLTSLRAWTQQNRYVRDMTCEEQRQFNITINDACTATE